ncbi:MAG: hypothetical protein M1822_004176 [Bathelium mastoideum]|nr:MAG: hypothetical protein M1822_004176 [Bathelium mastoideum]
MAHSSFTTKGEQYQLHQQKVPIEWTKRPLSIAGFGHTFVDLKEEPFQNEEYLGTGSSSYVWLGKSRETGAVVVVKTFRSATGKFDNTKKAFETEVNILRGLSHYHIVRYVGSYTCGLKLSILMLPKAICDLDLVLSDFKESPMQKEELQRAIAKPNWTIPQFLASIMGCLAHALQYLHNKLGDKVRHKDIKPANILFNGWQVQFTDFGTSRTFTAEQTGSTGPTAKTNLYASPETIADDKHHGRSADVYSLGLVFLEIFAFYRTLSVSTIREIGLDVYSKKRDVLISWMLAQCRERCDFQLRDLLAHMLDPVQENRPSAIAVWQSLVTFASNDGHHFCGACCMPVIRATTTESPIAESPHPLHYRREPTVKGKGEYGKDVDFETVYEAGQRPSFEWVRDLQMTRMTLMDEVKFANSSPLGLCRKRIFPSFDGKQHAEEAKEEAREAAKYEAKLLRKLDHPHILKLDGTYQQGFCYALLLKPAVDYELRYFLELASVDAITNSKNGLREALGCLVSAVAYLHGFDIVHGNISSSSIWVKGDQVFLAHFSDYIRRKIRGTHRGVENDDRDFSTLRYTSPGRFEHSGQVHTQADDIFALGCVLLEIQSVRQGKKYGEMDQFCISKIHKTYGEATSRLQEWITGLEEEYCETEPRDAFFNCLRSMVAFDVSERPTAKEVQRTIKGCRTTGGDDTPCRLAVRREDEPPLWS